MEFHFRRHFRLWPKMKNAFRSAEKSFIVCRRLNYGIHLKKVLVLNTRLGLGLPLDAMRGSLFDLTTGRISRYILLILLQNRRHIE